MRALARWLDLSNMGVGVRLKWLFGVFVLGLCCEVFCFVFSAGLEWWGF